MVYKPGGGGESGRLNKYIREEDIQNNERNKIMTYLEMRLDQKRKKCRTMVDISEISEWFQSVRDHKEWE
jgi:hypothetical protein